MRDQLFAMSTEDVDRFVDWFQVAQNEGGLIVEPEDLALLARIREWAARQSKPVMIRGD